MQRVLQISSNFDNPLYSILFDALRDLGIDSQAYQYAWFGRSKGRKSNLSNVDYAECYRKWERFFFHKKERSVLSDAIPRYELQKFDLIHGHTLFTDGYVAMQLSRRFEIPYLVSVRNVDVNTFFKCRVNLRHIGIEILREASGIVFISNNYKDVVLEKYAPAELRGPLFEKSRVISNGLSSVFLDNQPEQDELYRVPHDPIEIIQVGDISRNKNQIQTLKACASLIEQGYNIHFTVVGHTKDGAIKKTLEKYPWVTVCDFISQSDLIGLYRKSDIFSMLSKYETFGLVYLEAMSQGVPVLYTRGQGFDGLFPEGFIGCSVPYGDIPATESAIKFVVNNIVDLKCNALMGCRDYSWTSVAKKYRDVYLSSIK